MAETTYTVEYAKSGRSTCKRSKEKIPQGTVRIGKIILDPFNPESTQCQWHLPGPFFEMMRKMKATSKKVETVDDFAGFADLQPDDQAALESQVRDFWDKTVVVTKAPAKKRPKKEEASADGEDDDAAAEAKPKAAKKAKAEPKPKNAPHASEVVACAAADMRSLAETLVASARADGIKMPTDETAARVSAGAALQAAWDRSEGTVDMGACLDALEKQYKSTKGAKAMEVAVEANRALAVAFKELSSFNFEAQQKMRGLSYNKASKALATCDYEITSGKEAIKLDGVGKGCASRIDEFLASGTMEELDGFRSGTG